MATKTSKNDSWRIFQERNNELITITKLEGDLFYIRAWKKDGQSIVPSLKTIHSISQKASPTKLGAFIREIMNDANEKEKWLKS